MNARSAALDSLAADLRDALRSVRRAPGVSAAAILILALGIGANAAVWTALGATLLAEIEAPEAERLVVPRLTMSEGAADTPEMFPWSYPKYLVLREHRDRLVDPVAGYTTRAVTISGGGEAMRSDLQVADPALFELLGARPVLGALYTPRSVASDPLVAVLSHSLWASRYGADRGVTGRPIVVNGAPLTIVGVLPQGFHGLGAESGLWVPFEATASLFNPRQLEWPQAHWFDVLGRLREGVTLEEAREQMAVIGRAIDEAHPDESSSAVMGADLFPLSEVRRNRDAEAAMLLLAAAAGAVLLIACGNLVTLFLSRGAERSRDASIRQALGAGRWRIVRAALVESWLLSALGALAGLCVAAVGVRALARVWPERFVMGDARVRYADLEPLSLDSSTLVASLLLAAGASVLFGTLPALRVARGARLAALREGAVGDQPRGLAGRIGLRGALVVVQVALTLSLVASTGLLVQSLLRLSDVKTGVDAPEQVLSARYEIPRSSSAAGDPAGFHRRFVERLSAVPGVSSATVGSSGPFSGHDWITGVRRIDGRPEYQDTERPAVGVASVGDRFFETLGIVSLAGRTFDSRDRSDSSPVVVLSRSAAREVFGDEAPLGRSLALGIGLTPSGSETMAEVIGVVEDVLYERPERGVLPDVYVSQRQEPLRYAVALARTALDPLDLVAPMRSTLAQLDPEVPLFGAAALDDLRATGMGDTRVLGSLLAVFAAVALTLAAVGTYGTMSCWVDGRGRELGLRLALGARSGQVLSLVLGRGLAILGVGVILGGLLALASGRLLEGVLFEVRPSEPVALVAATVLLVVVGLVACWLPARRAGRTDPCSVLRGD